MKKCFKCSEEKEISEFYKHPEMADGHVNKCKECNKKDVILNRENKKDYYKEYDRKRDLLPHRVELKKRYAKNNPHIIGRINKKYRKNNKEKYKAHTIVNNAVRNCTLAKENCKKCGAVDGHAHHEDYSKPLEVIWLCQKCHNNVHKNIV